MIRTSNQALTYFDKSRNISNLNLNTNEMKTLKFEIQTLLAEPLTGEPTLVYEERIKRLQEAVLLLAERIDIHRENTHNHPIVDN